MIRLFNFLKKLPGLNSAGVGSKSVEDAIEHVVDGIDAKLRLVPSYQQKLHDAVLGAMQHIDSVVEQVPGPFDCSRKTYVKDPDVAAYFASPDTMQKVFSNSTELQAFFSDRNNADVDTGYALLCANKQEKTIIGSELAGDVVQHDIMQTTINFFDYKVLSPAINGYEVRQAIKQCIFDGFITYVLQHIASIKVQRRDLKNRRRILHSQLRVRQSGGNGLSSMLAEGHADKWQSEELEEQYLQTGRELEAMLGEQDVLSFYLEEIRQILSRPEDFIELNVACFRMTDMRIKVDDTATQPANSVCFSELEIANVMKRVVAVVSYSRDEMKYNH